MFTLAEAKLVKATRDLYRAGLGDSLYERIRQRFGSYVVECIDNAEYLDLSDRYAVIVELDPSQDAIRYILNAVALYPNSLEAIKNAMFTVIVELVEKGYRVSPIAKDILEGFVDFAEELEDTNLSIYISF